MYLPISKIVRSFVFIASLIYVANFSLAAENTMTPLDRALVAANNDSNERGKYYSLFLQSEIYIATHNVPEKEEEKHIPAGTAIQPIVLEFAGEGYVMLFDTKERLSAWAKKEIGFLRLSGHALVDMAPPDILWALNVGTEYTKLFPTDEIRWLKQRLAESQSKEFKFTEETKTLVGAPAKIPDGLVESLTKRLSKSKEVREAYLGQVYYNLPGEKPHLALALRMDKSSDALMEALKRDLGIVIQGLLGASEYMDFVTEQNEPIFSVIMKSVKPFYVR